MLQSVFHLQHAFLFYQGFLEVTNPLKHKKKRAMRCPYCGAPVVYRSAEGIYQENKKGAMLYVCSRYPECDAYVRVQPGTKLPLGTLANGDLRALRRQTHGQFDRLYKEGLMTKDGAYRWLGELLGLPQSQAHIGCLGEYNCRLVLEKSRELLEKRGRNAS